MGNTLDKLVKFFLFSAILGVAVSYSKIYLFHVSLFIIIVYILSRKVKNERVFNVKLFQTKELFFWFVLFFIALLSVFWSLNKVLALQNIFYLFNGMSILLIIVLYVSDYNKLFRIIPILFVGFFLNMLFGLLETVSNFRLPISPYSNYLELFGRGGNDLSKKSQAITEYLMSMPTGFNWNPNDFSVSMIIFLPFFLFSKNKLVSIFGALTILYLIIQAGSRTNFVAFVMIVAIFLFIKYKKTFLSVSAAIIICLIIIGSVSSFKVEDRKVLEALGSFKDIQTMLTTKQESDNSIGLRQNLLIAGVKSIKDTKGIGIGIGNSIYVATIYNVTDVPYSLHNFWFQILVELGFIIFMGLIIWYVYVVIKLYLNAKGEKNDKIKRFTLATSLSMVGFFIGSISMSSSMYFLPMWLLFGVATALIRLYKIKEV